VALHKLSRSFHFSSFKSIIIVAKTYKMYRVHDHYTTSLHYPDACAVTFWFQRKQAKPLSKINELFHKSSLDHDDMVKPAQREEANEERNSGNYSTFIR